MAKKKSFSDHINDLHPSKLKVWVTPKTRREAAKALGRSRRKEAIEPLIRALDDPGARTIDDDHVAAGVEHLAQVQVERQSIQKYTTTVAAKVKSTRDEMNRLHRSNLELEQRLEKYHREIQESIDAI